MSERPSEQTLVAVMVSREDVEDVEEHGRMNIDSYGVKGERASRQPWEWHQGKRLLALAKRLKKALDEADDA